MADDPASIDLDKKKPAHYRPGDRHVKVRGHEVQYVLQPDERPFGDNMVITSSYTWWNFIFVNLYEQFCNLANLYFLFIGILQIIPWVSTTKGQPTMYQPLAFIVAVSAIRAATEDWAKHKSDAKRNDYEYLVWGDKGFEKVRSGDIKVGHILLVHKDEMIPADLVFIASSEPKGHCFIDKANLNGETTLEVLSSIKETRPFAPADGPDEEKMQDKQWKLDKIDVELFYEPPNKKFDRLRATLLLATGQGSPTEITANEKVLLMRETTLRNCTWIIGLVIYNGNDTKIQKSNSEGGKPKLKKSIIMRLVDKYLIFMLLLQVGFCFFGGVYAGVWRGQHNHLWYFGQYKDWETPALDGFLAFFSWFILMSQMVPISLIVSSEIVKTIQSWFIQFDITLYYPPIDKPTKVNSSTHHEDLGLVDYVFSDKTGTLTQNKMTFRYALLADGEFGSKETEIAKSVKQKNQELADRESGLFKPKDPMPWTTRVAPLTPREKPGDREPDCCERTCWKKIWLDEDLEARRKAKLAAIKAGGHGANEFTQQEKEVLLKCLWGTEGNATLRKKAQLYMRHMALSGTVKPFEKDGELKFQCESAEESAMVQFARDCGFTKLQTGPTILEIKHFDPTDLTKGPVKTIQEQYEHVATFGFTSKRARVTVIYRECETDKIHIMIKGQDTVLLPLLSKADFPDENKLLLALKNMGSNGLRTLVCGYSVLDRAWWDSREDHYKDAITRDETDNSIGHPDKCKKAPDCEKCYVHDLFEKWEREAKLLYLGCLGLEDQLQLLVPETIQDCLRAGVKVWMITGDKLDTAKNIGLATNLIDPDMQVQLSASDDVQKSIEKIRKSRLLEITGTWAELGMNEDAMSSLFDMFDQNRNGFIEKQELEEILRSLGLPDSVLKHSSSVIASADVSKSGSLGRKEFIQFISSVRLSPYEAVKHDLDEAWETYGAIRDHQAEPVSILVNRSAFEVMFPGKKEARPAGTGRRESDVGEPEEKLEILRKRFFDLAGRSKSVVFARAQPAMKKKMVTEIMARYPKAVTLAIGDGANDTDMITAAHVGVGIAGVEGTAATNSADYAIGTFRMLHTLLFVHGFWSYQRISDLVNFIFYKASLVAMTGFFFGFYSGYSGQQFYNDPIYQLYNVVFTALPILVVAIFDQKLPRHILENNPAAFREAKHKAFNSLVFGGWILRSFLHSLILFFVPVYSLGYIDIGSSNGRTHGLWYTSTVIYFGVVLVPTFVIFYTMLSVTAVHFLSIFLSVLALFIMSLMASIFVGLNPDLYGVMIELYADPLAWFTMILIVSIPMILEIIYRGVKRDLRPSLTEILQERIRLRRHAAKRKTATVPDAVLQADADEHATRIPKGSVIDGQNFEFLNYEDEAKFYKRKPHRPKETPETKGVPTPAEEVPREGDAVKMNVVRAMLRFKNLTGSQFDSAAQAKYQVHDTMGRGKTESKQTQVLTATLITEEDERKEGKREVGATKRDSASGKSGGGSGGGRRGSKEDD